MLILASTADKIRVITSFAVPVDVHATWADFDGAAVTAGRTNTEITLATTTDVVASPAIGFYRKLKTLIVRNTDPVTSVDVTVQHTDGATPVSLEKVTLLPNESLSYSEGEGFRHTLASGATADSQEADTQTYVAAGAGVTVNRVVYKNSVAHEVAHALASGLATSDTVVGIAVNSAAAGALVGVVNDGLVTADATAGITILPGQKIFLSEISAGEVTNVEPSLSGEVKLFLGVSKTGTAIAGGTFTIALDRRTPTLIP
jgi:hypothetical protein